MPETKQVTKPTSVEDKITDSSQIEKKTKGKKKKSQKSKEKQPEKKLEKKRYKILAGNGCHQAICEVQGMLIPPTDEGGKFQLILPDGLQVDAYFKTPRQHWLAKNNPEFITGMHWFRCYPKMANDKLVALQIVSWDGDMSNNKGEQWEFIGVWTAQRNITVQRTMSNKEIRKIAKEEGFIKKFKFTFTNSFDFKRNLWVGYVYQVLASREGDKLKIRKVNPYACPRIKPKPPERKPRK